MRMLITACIILIWPLLSWSKQAPEVKSECWKAKFKGSNVFCECESPRGTPPQCVPRTCIDDDQDQSNVQARQQGQGNDAPEMVQGKMECINGLSRAEGADCKQAMIAACLKVIDRKGEPGEFGKKMLGENDQEAPASNRPNDSGTGCKQEKAPKIMGRFWPDERDIASQSGARGSYSSGADNDEKKKVPNACAAIIGTEEKKPAT